MIHNKQIRSARRIFSFPAVNPRESISPATRLDSLIDLAHRICSFKSRLFFTNKRDVRQTFRHVDNLLVILQEVRSSSSGLPVSVVLSLSELHLNFQKILYLLEDCTRDGARLWILMNSARVNSYFVSIIRSIATGLVVFPFGDVDLPIEISELTELVTRQASEARIGVESDDNLAINAVNRILTRFETGCEPDQTEVIMVLDYLGISKWSDCNKEIKFLDAEIQSNFLNTDKKIESSLSVSSLSAFMSYCRCVIIVSVDSEVENSQIRRNCDVLRGLNPDDFRCPISLELMTEPVTISTGHTYDRASLSRWFKSGNHTCPKTGEKLTSTELVPNLILKSLIHQFCTENDIVLGVDSNRKKNPKKIISESSASEGAMEMIALFIAEKLAIGSCEEIDKAALEVRILTKTSVFNRSCLVESGTIKSLLKLLPSTNSRFQDNSMASLLNLSKNPDAKTIIVDNRGLDSIVFVLNNGLKPETKQHAAATLFYLASIEDYSRLIGEIPNSIPGLVKLLSTNSSDDRARRNALVAIFGLLTHPSNHWRVLAANAVPVLIEIIKSSERDDLITDSLAILSSLAEKPDGFIAIIRRGGLNLAVKTLDSCSSIIGKEYCVSLLLAMCNNGGADVVGALVKIQSLMGSLYSLVDEGTARAGKKSSALIRLLHGYYEKNSSSRSIRPVVLQERFVHAW